MSSFEFRSWIRRAYAIGNINAVDEQLQIQNDTNHVGTIIPSKSLK